MKSSQNNNYNSQNLINKNKHFVSSESINFLFSNGHSITYKMRSFKLVETEAWAQISLHEKHEISINYQLKISDKNKNDDINPDLYKIWLT